LTVFLDQSNRVGRQRKRRSTNDDEVISLDFEMSEREELPTDIEESTLNIYLTNDHSSHVIDKTWKADRAVNDSESDYDENSSLDVATKKLTLKSHRNRSKSHNHHHRHEKSRNKVQVITNKQMIRLHVYQSTSQGRTFLFSKDITLPINSEDTKFIYKKWIPLDLTSIVNKWLQDKEQTLSIDIYCESCSKYGLKIVNNHETNPDNESRNNPALNIVGSVVRTKRKSGHRKHGQLDEAKDYTITQPKKTFCRQDGDKKCCRHKWVIDFKELGGYDYIIQPRNFDAGFCDGTCPYKYNVANNHAFFQSLARHQLKNSNVPNVCCAPARLVDMEVLHIDENDHKRLKVTTMKKMRVMKCSCT
jgi:transforming growth factor beta, invertebrate